MFTFHYVSILMISVSQFWPRLDMFTFHYVSILIQNIAYFLLCFYVYIPLCLYFNDQRWSSVHCQYRVYIPLCLYFNQSVHRVIHLSRIWVYIPLCLYFNCLRALHCLSSASFTFHYVSILIFCASSSCAVRPTFTFHYVSILIIVQTDPAGSGFRLHSIMSLF